MSKTVFIESGNTSYSKLFIDAGFTEVNHPEEAEIIVFTGGADVTPMFYGEAAHEYTHFSLVRDWNNIALYRHAAQRDKICVGICRGAQFLNVMAGGSMNQHITGHMNTHNAVVLATGEVFSVTSDHHQEILLGGHSVALMLSQGTDDPQPVVEGFMNTDYVRMFGVQGHPEYTDASSAFRKFFFESLEELIEQTSE